MRFTQRKQLIVGFGALFVLVVVIAALAGGDDESTTTTPRRSTPTAEPAAPEATTPTRSTPTRTTPSQTSTTRTFTRDDIEDCLDPWDGNHNGFEDSVRAGLNDPGSMKTYDTYFGITPTDGRVPIRMDYGARNAFGGMVRTQATGSLDIASCRVTVYTYGYE